jgi:hypothetical protein
VLGEQPGPAQYRVMPCSDRAKILCFRSDCRATGCMAIYSDEVMESWSLLRARGFTDHFCRHGSNRRHARGHIQRQKKHAHLLHCSLVYFLPNNKEAKISATNSFSSNLKIVKCLAIIKLSVLLFFLGGIHFCPSVLSWFFFVDFCFSPSMETHVRLCT